MTNIASPPAAPLLRTTVCWNSCHTLCGMVARGCPASVGVGAVSSSGTISAQLKMGVPDAGKRSVTLTALAVVAGELLFCHWTSGEGSPSGNTVAGYGYSTLMLSAAPVVVGNCAFV